MRKHRRIWIAALALIAVACAVYFEPTHCVRGWLWGEAFFDGRPTSYWRGELEHWKVAQEVHFWGNPGYRFEREPPWTERTFGWWPWKNAQHCPSLLSGDEAAIPVLQKLREDKSPEVRRLAEIGLELCESTIRRRLIRNTPPGYL